ncbi:outer membrane lipase/esterase [Azospirillum brasilense]|uniref:Outer membrane lipase/esterase n=2 Tax=Azospirillum brasilense TaxID=192 RepID=A0A560BP32_AZOBR|nr:outer membrane lipase/esterase [Azospirillum brasilense]
MRGKAIRMAAGAALLASAPAGAVPFDRVFVFGDSLSDTGRVHELTRGAIPQSPPYYDGRFSNGPVWVERLAPLIGSQPDQKTNFAYGGAETGTLSQTGVPGIQGQVGQFLLSRPGGTNGGLFAVWAGGNDYFNRVSAGSDPSGLVSQTVGNIVTTVERLAALGGKTFLVPNLPDLGTIPDTRNSDRATLLNAVTASHNTLLSQAMADVEKRLGVTVVVADVNALYRAVAANPMAYGFTNTVTPCLTNNAPTGACGTEAQADQTVYWDEIHPTRAAHLLIAQYMQGALLALNDAAETVAMQPELAFEATRSWHRALLGSIAGPAATRVEAPIGNGELRAFLIGDAAWGRLGGTAERQGFRFNTQSGGVGAELPVGPASGVGLSVGGSRGRAKLDEGAGTLDMTSTIIGLHAVTEARGFQLAVAGSVSFDRYGDIDRTTGFAPFPNASAETDGRTYALSVAGGYTAQLGAVALGPRLGLRYIHTRIDGYQESGAGLLSLGVERQSAESLESSVGAEASTIVEIGRTVLQPSLGIAWEHQFAEDARTVTVRLPGGAANSVSPSGDGRDSLVIGAGLSAQLWQAVGATVGYRGELSGADGHNHAFTARLRMSF